MRLTEDIKPVTYMETQATELLHEVKRSRRPVVITQQGKAQAVIMDVATYEALRDAILSVQLMAQGEEDVLAGRTVSQAEVFVRARRRLARDE